MQGNWTLCVKLKKNEDQIVNVYSNKTLKEQTAKFIDKRQLKKRNLAFYPGVLKLWKSTLLLIR